MENFPSSAEGIRYLPVELFNERFYSFLKQLKQLWEEFMAGDYLDDRIIFRLSSEDDIELENLGDGFSGLAREFREHLKDQGLDPADAPSKLFVTEVKSGSIEFELATLASLYIYAEKGASSLLIWTNFYERVRGTLDYLVDRAPRPGFYTRECAKNYDAFLRTISGKRGARH